METPKEQKRSSQLSRQEVRLLWYCDYWDGPLSGICFYQGQRYWFEAIEPEKENYGYPRRVGIYILSTEELQAEEESQQRFQASVGMHTTYDEQDQRPISELLRPGEEHEKFYSWYKQQPRRDYRHNKMVGWFEL